MKQAPAVCNPTLLREAIKAMLAGDEEPMCGAFKRSVRVVVDGVAYAVKRGLPNGITLVDHPLGGELELARRWVRVVRHQGASADAALIAKLDTAGQALYYARHQQHVSDQRAFVAGRFIQEISK